MAFSLYFLFGILGVILGLIAYVSYFRAISRGETRPHMYTWLIWGILGITGSVISWHNGGGWGVLVPIMMGVMNTSLAIFAYFHGEKTLTLHDKKLLACCGGMFLFWLVTKNPLGTIVIGCLIESIGFYFTWRKTWSQPYGEDLTSYVIWTFEFLFAFLAIEHHNIINSMYPAYLFFSELLFLVYLWWRRRVVKN